MRLTELARNIAVDVAQRYAEKRASALGFALPVAAGMAMSSPNILQRTHDRYTGTREGLDRAALEQLYPTKTAIDWTQFAQGMTGQRDKNAPATGSSMGGSIFDKMVGPLLEAPGSVVGAHLNKLLGPRPGFGEAKDPLHMMGSSAVQAFGKEMGTVGAHLLQDMASKATAAIGQAGDNSAREAILKQLRREDLVIHDADDKTLMEAYHTMARFAPVLSTDKNAVRSFLRQAVMSGNGPDYMSIKLLADAERAVTGEKEKR